MLYLNETPIEKIDLDGHDSVLLATARHQHFMNASCLIGKAVDNHTYDILPSENVVVALDDIVKKTAIGVASDGTYHEAPEQTPWSERA